MDNFDHQIICNNATMQPIFLSFLIFYKSIINYAFLKLIITLFLLSKHEMNLFQVLLWFKRFVYQMIELLYISVQSKLPLMDGKNKKNKGMLVVRTFKQVFYKFIQYCNYSMIKMCVSIYLSLSKGRKIIPFLKTFKLRTYLMI